MQPQPGCGEKGWGPELDLGDKWRPRALHSRRGPQDNSLLAGLCEGGSVLIRDPRHTGR